MHNLIIENNYKSLKPIVGMGVTQLLYSDRRAFTVIRIVDDKTIFVQEDTAVRMDNNGMSDSQRYSYNPNPNGHIYELRMCVDGHWRNAPFMFQNEFMSAGAVFMVGHRDAYHDYSY